MGVQIIKGVMVLSGRVGVSPAGDRVSRARTWKDRFGKMPKPAGGTPTLPEI